MGKRAFAKLFVYVSVLEGGLGGALGADGGWLPLPTRTQKKLKNESKSGKMSVLEANCVRVMLEGGLGGALGVDRGWLPLPIHLQQYCDPASFVLYLHAHIKTFTFSSHLKHKKD